MNTELCKRLITKKSPFSGQIIRFYFDNEEATEPGFDECLQSIAAVWSILQREHTAFYQLEDWFDHDGFLTTEKRITCSQVTSWFQSTSALWHSRHDDAEVAMSIFPENYAWYFRVMIDGDAVDTACGYWDLYADTALIQRVREALSELSVTFVTLQTP